MKRTYNYHTERMTNRSLYSNGRKRLYEAARNITFDDILENAKNVYRDATGYNAGTLNFKKVLLNFDKNRVTKLPITGRKAVAVWEHRGNFSAREFMKICNKVGLEYCYISGKTGPVEGNIEDTVYLTGDPDSPRPTVVIIDNFTYGPAGQVEDFIDEIDDILHSWEMPVQIICIGDIDSPNNDVFANDIARVFANYVLATPDDVDEIPTYESVAEKFAKYRKLYENEDEEETEETSDTSEDNSNVEDEKVEDTEDSKEDEETEDVPMTAIVLTIKKEDVEKCKEELVNAGISEDGITEVDNDDDEDNAKLKVDADYAFELKDYLAGKGIDLEEKIGGEIIDDSVEDSDEDKEGEDNKEDEDKPAEDDTDFDAEFGDLFGDDDESADNE